MKYSGQIPSFFRFLLPMLLVLLLWQCQQEEPIPDVSDIPVDLQLRRFEKDLFGIDTSRFAEGLSKLEEEYPEFGEIFFGQLLGSKDSVIAPEGHVAYVKGFVSSPFVRKLYDTCLIVYPDLEGYREDLTEAFRFFKYYFPDRQVPDVTTFLSEFTVANFIYGENSLATGLDFFLGPGFPYMRYNPGNSNFSDYLTRSYNRDHLASKTLKPLIEDLVGDARGNRLLDQMVQNGKKLYLLDHLLPYVSDTVIMEYSPAQLAWCEENELEIWAHFLREELLYSSNWQDYRKLVEYSPNSPGMPPEAPGRTANWIGWQIVRSYMKRHPETRMTELLELDDAQRLLDGARYRPDRR